MTIGAFSVSLGMFERNILTSNPGWDYSAREVNPLKDVRVLQEELKEKGIEFAAEVDWATKGPGSFMILHPDGNPILFDRHR
jgi:lactoylglutathione lyase